MEKPRARSIVLMEDDAAYRYVVAKALEAAGYQVTAAEDYREVLRVIEEGVSPVDLLLLDIFMPPGRPHGIAVAKMALARRPRLKVVFFTAFYGDLPGDEIGIAPGPVLRKSGDTAPLLAAIADVFAAP
jgi:CheY-like chemotaxis protein